MQIWLSFLMLLGLAPCLAGQAQVRVTIIESTSANPFHDMDEQWRLASANVGYAATIVPQSTLANTAFFTQTDILIVSSGVISLSAPAVDVIRSFLAQGGSVYLQGEYAPSYDTNQAFAYLIQNDGASFTVGETVSGDLHPVDVLGSFATTPGNAGPLGYFWYGCSGVGGAEVTPFLHYLGDDLGWTYTSTSGGRLAQTTDQDWVRAQTEPQLLENLLDWLGHGGGLWLSGRNFVAGGAARLQVSGATPGGSVLLAYSLTGPGPTPSPFGDAALSRPIYPLPTQTVGPSGFAFLDQALPLSAQGIAVWIQAFDVLAWELSNGLARVIE